MNIQFGLLETKSTMDKPVRCSDKNCSRSIDPDGACFIDIENSALLCDHCGKSERYARKKQDAREKAGITETPLIKG
ncbi:MAG: hypothetical protein ACXADH_06605, partial [Candidatus Kariarchaeaceae archaeon]